MKNILTYFILFAMLTGNLSAGEFTGEKAHMIIPGASLVYTNDNTGFPLYFQFQKGKEISFSKFTIWVNSFLREPQNASFKLISSYSDKQGYIHFKYQQLYKNIPVDKGLFFLHTKNNQIISFSGNLYVNISSVGNEIISSEQAVDIAKNTMNAEIYKWEIPAEENQLKKEKNDPKATYYPAPLTGIYANNLNSFRKVYAITLYAHKPIDKKEYIIDADNGKVLEIRQKLYAGDVTGTAVTKYSGNQTITTDSYAGTYRLREVARGNGIETYNVNTGTSYGSATDFTDDDNYWNNFNAQFDEAATDAHWAAEKTYDYFFNNFGFNSIDNAGFKLISYVHYDVNYQNAFWDGQRMTYGDGSSTPFTTVDIAGHEITHGLTEFNAGLVYQDESGALNEGYSDIFGTAVEFYAKPSAANWTLAEDLGSPFRSLQDPNSYGDPDTYFGTNWYTGSADNGGVHTNSQVIAHWFYLVSVGGSGTNDLGNTYSVNGIGINEASQIAFRTLVNYLTPNATYEDARFFSILSAIDLYGPCTPQVESVTNAMYAVGLGVPYVPSVVADFSSSLTTSCSTPFTVNFQNLSNNSTSFLWDFGDGNTSTAVSPSHTYTSFGNYNVSLTADGGTCGIDTNIKPSFISIDAANPCIVVMPTSGTGITQNACSGTLFDGGGPTGNYIDNADAVITITPTGATNVTLNFVSFDVEPGDLGYCNYDYLEIFDGPNTGSTSLGQFCNLTGSPGTISSTGGSITLLLHSDQGLNLPGFEAGWTCSLANTPPVADFSLTPSTTCTGDVMFTDFSSNGPTSWLWNFGDGNTSSIQNPVHNYTANGVYNVTLIAINSYGSDTIVYNGIVTVNRPLSPTVTNDTICENQQALLSATGSGTINWYSALTGGTLLYSGSVFTTPALTVSAIYYVENTLIASSQYVGNTQSSSNGGTFTASNEHYIIFDCTTPCSLVSVEVNATTSGNRVIELRDATGTTLQSATVNIPSGVSRINLNFDIPVGTNLRLVGPGSPNLWRNNAGVTYPYVLAGLVSINSSSAGTNPQNYYYYFYDWEVKESDCISPRVPVTAFVENCLGIQETSLVNIKLYPNPVEDKFNIEIPFDIIVNRILITDIIGNENIISEFNKTGNLIEMDISPFSSGIYFVTFETDRGRISKKLFKE